MKPISIKEIREKEVRRLHKEWRENWNKQRQLGYKKLEKPIRNGWFKELVLLDKLERYKCKPEIEEIAKKLTLSVWGRTKEIAQKKWDGQQSKHLIYRNIPTLSPKSYRKLSDKAKKHCTVFQYRCNKKWRKRYYVRIPKYTYKIKFVRAYTTHTKIIDPKLESRDDLIQQQLNKKGWYGIANQNNSCKCNWLLVEKEKAGKQIDEKLKRYKYFSLEEIENKILWERN